MYASVREWAVWERVEGGRHRRPRIRLRIGVNTGNIVGDGAWSLRFCKPRWSTSEYNDSVSIERYLLNRFKIVMIATNFVRINN